MNFTELRWIEHWLDAIPNPSTAREATQSKPYHLASTDDYWAQMTPPPSGPSNSSGGRPGGSPKRPRVDSPEAEDNDMTLGEDTQRTPRSKPGPGNASLDHRPIPMRGMSNVPSLPPSQPSNASHATTSVPPSEVSPPRPEGSPTRGKRQKSPVKNANSLRAMELPVISVALSNDPANTLPPDVHGLFQSIQDITDDHECFIPSEIKEDIRAIIPRAKNGWFLPPDDVSTPDNDDARPRTRKPRLPTDIAIAELDTLRDIEVEAQGCKLRECSELAWNMLVHMPLLRHALSGHPTVHVEPSMSARIAPQFVPSTGGRGGGNVIESKMIDFSLVLRLNHGTPDPIQENVPEADARLMKVIANRVWAQPGDSQTFNQTVYSPLQFAPIACSIETKIATSNRDGQLQLSVWTAAWYQRMRILLPQGSPMVTLPLIMYVITYMISECYC